MLFNRTYNFKTHLSEREIKERLLEQHVKVNDMDFEICDNKEKLKIIPHAEHAADGPTLPITHINMIESGDGTSVSVFTKLRRIDAGLPYLVTIFSVLCIAGGIALYLVKSQGSWLPSMGMLAIGIVIFVLYWIKLETGYFTYGRKLAVYVKEKLAAN